MNKTIFSFFIMFFILISNVEACRFWVASGESLDVKLVEDQLLREPNSLKVLGTEYKDGWSISYYDKVNAVIKRSAKPAALDRDFDETVKKVARQNSQIILAHLRRASSGCVEGVENPHPFKRVINGKTWLFGHNGGIPKEILMDLIGAKYLLHHAPQVCTYDVPDSWIDSELYFIYLLKNIEENNWNVEKGLLAALNKLYDVLEKDKRYLNFFLSDGVFVWAFRRGNDLFYNFSEKYYTTLVASSVPEGGSMDWSAVPEDVLMKIEKGKFPEFLPLK